ncbi:rhomboid family intramembrane serine protease [Halapricum hydrolyticum]|uniref:Rhomboid family intramembrane serine protease n=1 Tax=Halapricum hydrolyticum TaxID=2979991 RepID=A0AAE3LFS1_9EURY|nr:rhomboid family intramembrane serine protease [Halapricum hydrolyticum]MCU4719081.1 rhomboid family intramembrane serine protease [Halapricum hydrolyticum]MCU4728146.1 rhomboid family intramembrane serine protease [Halapricum hydrolyticum]
MNRTLDLSVLDAIVREYTEAQSPVTQVLIIVIGVVFVGELLGAALLTKSNSVRIFATGIFAVHPWVAWPLSPVLHKGLQHFLASVLFALLYGIPVEKHWNWKAYSAFIIVTGYATIVSGTASLWLFSDSQLAFYGASGIIYALAGYSFTHFTLEHDDMDLVEKVALFFGVIALVSVVFDIVTGPYFTPEWINGGHLSGFVIGGLAGYFGPNECNDQARSETCTMHPHQQIQN